MTRIFLLPDSRLIGVVNEQYVDLVTGQPWTSTPGVFQQARSANIPDLPFQPILITTRNGAIILEFDGPNHQAGITRLSFDVTNDVLDTTPMISAVPLRLPGETPTALARIREAITLGYSYQRYQDEYFTRDVDLYLLGDSLAYRRTDGRWETAVNFRDTPLTEPRLVTTLHTPLNVKPIVAWTDVGGIYLLTVDYDGRLIDQVTLREGPSNLALFENLEVPLSLIPVRDQLPMANIPDSNIAYEYLTTLLGRFLFYVPDSLFVIYDTQKGLIYYSHDQAWNAISLISTGMFVPSHASSWKALHFNMYTNQEVYVVTTPRQILLVQERNSHPEIIAQLRVGTGNESIHSVRLLKIPEVGPFLVDGQFIPREFPHDSAFEDRLLFLVENRLTLNDFQTPEPELPFRQVLTQVISRLYSLPTILPEKLGSYTLTDLPTIQQLLSSGQVTRFSVGTQFQPWGNILLFELSNGEKLYLAGRWNSQTNEIFPS
jgi:hypothetical protein